MKKELRKLKLQKETLLTLERITGGEFYSDYNNTVYYPPQPPPVTTDCQVTRDRA